MKPMLVDIIHRSRGPAVGHGIRVFNVADGAAIARVTGIQIGIQMQELCTAEIFTVDDQGKPLPAIGAIVRTFSMGA